MIYYPKHESHDIDPNEEIIVKNSDDLYLKIGADLVVDKDFVSKDWDVKVAGGWLKLKRRNGLHPGHNAILYINKDGVLTQHSFFVKKTYIETTKENKPTQISEKIGKVSIDFIPSLMFSDKLFYNKGVLYVKNKGSLKKMDLDKKPRSIHLTSNNTILVKYPDNTINVNIGLPFWLSISPNVIGKTIFSDDLIVTYNKNEISCIYDFSSSPKEVIWEPRDVDEEVFSSIQVDSSLVLVNFTKVLKSCQQVSYTKISLR